MKKKRRDDLPGFTCECGRAFKFSPWVWLHLFPAVIHTCFDCARQHVINEGKATLVGREKKQRKK